MLEYDISISCVTCIIFFLKLLAMYILFLPKNILALRNENINILNKMSLFDISERDSSDRDKTKCP